MTANELHKMHAEWLAHNELPADLGIGEDMLPEGFTASQSGWLECFHEVYFEACERESS